jgi:hypothetical protein
VVAGGGAATGKGGESNGVGGNSMGEGLHRDGERRKTTERVSSVHDTHFANNPPPLFCL